MIKNLLWGIVAIAVIAITVYADYRRRHKQSGKPSRGLTKEQKKQLEIEKSRRPPPRL